MASIKLIVVKPFGTFRRGDVIAEPAKVARALVSAPKGAIVPIDSFPNTNGKYLTADEIVEEMAKAHWEADPYAGERASWEQLDAVKENDLLIGQKIKEELRHRMRAALGAVYSLTKGETSMGARNSDFSESAINLARKIIEDGEKHRNKNRGNETKEKPIGEMLKDKVYDKNKCQEMWIKTHWKEIDEILTKIEKKILDNMETGCVDVHFNMDGMNTRVFLTAIEKLEKSSWDINGVVEWGDNESSFSNKSDLSRLFRNTSVDSVTLILDWRR